MSASRRLRGWFWRGLSSREGDEQAPQRSSRNRRRPHFDGLEPRQLWSGNPPIREFPISTPTSQPLGITRGPDGSIWFTQSGPYGTPRIGRITPAGVVTGFASGLRADDFRKHVHAVRVSPDAVRSLGRYVVTLAETEGLPAHAESVRRRLRALGEEEV